MTKKKSTKKKSEKKSSEKVCETFEVEKEGKEKEVTGCGIVPEKKASKEELKKQNIILRNFLILAGGLILFVVIFYLSYGFLHTENYNDVEFTRIKEGEVTFYHTSVLFTKDNTKINQNIYLRTSPKELLKIPFEGDFRVRQLIGYNLTSNFDCEGDGIIAVANLRQVMNAFGIEVLGDPEAGCDSEGRYLYFSLKEGDETKIIQTSETCYDFYISNCEILPVTEKYIAEFLDKVNFS